jgi:4,5:9,10-diseco-3-hydroxy-5,9,17-trioxoandrosta-1(10),2-diene-4-oate hydrolase
LPTGGALPIVEGMPTSVFAARLGARTSDHRLLGQRVHLLELGPPAGPPVLLVHGASGGAGWFYKNVPALVRAGRRVLLPDLPGFGRSSRPGGKPAISFAWYGRVLEELLDRLRVDRVDLVGQSMGGAVSLALALHRPERVRHLVLVSSAALGKEVALPLVLASVPRLGEGLFRAPLAVVRHFHARWLYGHPSRLDDEMAWYDWAGRTVPGTAETWISLVRPEPSRFWRALFEGQAAVMLRDRLAALRSRTLVVWGRRDRILPLHHGEAAARLVPGAALEVHEEAGHMPHFEDPARFDRTLGRFLDG